MIRGEELDEAFMQAVLEHESAVLKNVKHELVTDPYWREQADLCKFELLSLEPRWRVLLRTLALR